METRTRCRKCDWLLDEDGYCTNVEGPCWHTKAPQTEGQPA